MKKFKCEICGKETTETCELDGKVMCTECRDGHTVVCSRCRKRIWNDDNYGDDHIDLCSDCYGMPYTRCDRCNAILTYDAVLYYDDEDIPYCDDCYDAVANERIIHGYNYKPYPIFYGDSKMHLGVELEIDDGGEDSDNAQKIMNVANVQHDHLYCKHDGSIDNGFELVTHPMDLMYHRTVMPWKAILETVANLGYRSHQTSTCGLHIHVSRCALGNTYTQKEGIAIEKENGVYKGRKPIECANLVPVVSKWKKGEITAVEAMKKLNLKPSTFYRKVKAM